MPSLIESFSLGVCYPVQSRTRPRRHLLGYLVPVVAFAVGMAIPKAFELNFKVRVQPWSLGNMTTSMLDMKQKTAV